MAGPVTLVTGASGGIGSALCRALAAAGFVTGALVPVTGGIEILSPISAIAKGA